LPDAWSPSRAVILVAQELHFDEPAMTAELAKFASHFRANGKTMVDWDQAAMNWLRRTLEFPRGSPSAAARNGQPKGPDFAARAFERRRLEEIGANAATDADPEAAWGEVQNQIRVTGYYRAPRFTDPAIAEAVQIMGWQTLCTADLDDEPANRKHFWDIYRSCKRRENQQAVREAASGITPIGGKSTKQIAS
jgi:hypothetical protein